jgi:aspartate aminotransferase-like enzyme
MYTIMTPGPTQVRKNVLLARAMERTNPDLDPQFYDFYKETCSLIGELLGTKNEVLILGGEGILGLEAACASLTQPQDRVLVIDNGIYGKGFADFVNLYGGDSVLYTRDYKNPIAVEELQDFLEKDHNFKYATLVHCDTPSGILNDISRICPLLKKFGIMTLVDSVSGSFGEEVHVDAYGIDILCGGSQKVVSAPPGLSFLTISKEAIHAIKNRRTPIASYYANLLAFEDYYEKKWFPYTMPISDIYGLRVAMDNIKNDPDIIMRHARIGHATRTAVTQAGLSLHLQSGYSNTVTVIDVPGQVRASDILETMREKYHIMLAGSFDVLAGQVIRIGHMGENATIENMTMTMEALDQTCMDLNILLKASLKDVFLQTVSQNTPEII